MINQVKKNIRTLTGLVVSDKMTSTIVVSVEFRVQDPLYGKFMRRRIKLLAHDETKTAAIGDLVMIKESRPLSRQKNWTLVEVIEKSQ